MGHWRFKSTGAWEYLQEDLNIDIALVQESLPNSGFTKNIIWRPVSSNRQWGSCVYSKKCEIKEVKFMNSFPGALTIADIKVSDKNILTCISLYGLLDEFGYSIPNLHKMVSDITYFLKGKLGKKNIIIGGDFNASIMHDIQRGNNEGKILFQRLEDLGLINVLDKFYDSPIQTLRHNKSNKPWQNDYVYVSKNLAETILSARVILNNKLKDLSDHNPILITFYF